MEQTAKKAKLEAVKEAEPKKEVTYIAFNRENGVQVVFPNGKFLRHVRKVKENINSGNDSDYHVIGITDVLVHDYGLTIVLKSGAHRHFPYNSIASFTVE